MRLILRGFMTSRPPLPMPGSYSKAALRPAITQGPGQDEPEDPEEQSQPELEDIDETLDETRIEDQIIGELTQSVPEESSVIPSGGHNQENAIIIPDDEIPTLDLPKPRVIFKLRRNTRVENPRRSIHIKLLVAKAAHTPQPTQPTTPPSSRFMALPGELRNRIYSYALHSPTPILLTKSTWSTHEPALLRTSSLIRKEATSLFYYENSFSAEIASYDGSVNDRFHALRTKYKTLRRQAHHHFTGGPSWGNLLSWLREIHAGRMVGIHVPGMGKERTVERKVVGACFGIVEAGRRRGVGWAVVWQMLEWQHVVLAQIDRKWA